MEDESLKIDSLSRLLDFIIGFVDENKAPENAKKAFTPSLIREIHRISSEHLTDAEGGAFRSVRVQVGPHVPVEPSQVEAEVNELCDYVRSNWDEAESVHLAAYVLWKLNWTHPFTNGNGRTARALAYLVLSLKLGGALPGTPTIPEQITANRPRYLDALQSADEAWRTNGRLDVGALESMLHDMLLVQLLAMPALPPRTRGNIESIIRHRIISAPAEMKSSVYSEQAELRMWGLADYLLLQVSDLEDIAAAEERHLKVGSPFPNLIAPDVQSANVIMSEGDLGARVPARSTTEPRVAIYLDPGSALTVEYPSQSYNTDEGTREWRSGGAIYVIRYGVDITADNVHTAVDVLVARHMMLLNLYQWR